ncbi:DNA primase [Aestuariispira insulae]|uniref:DNA primase n=1 Tax=Aestuariispira insulae TaxID=1461337 RepID=A0A3D9H9D7_9PROT|nr:DNA primase [Aestuariispira insulae]RED46098.1 DNA primase [Aestuariispira insulae]
MAYPHGFLDEVRARIRVSEIVSQKVKLTRRGNEYVGLSPFKTEKTPSFTVNDQKGFYHCFATGEHGDIFTFLIKTSGLSFPEAVEQLANQAGLEVPKASPEQAAREKKRHSLYEVMEIACQHYQRALRSSAGAEALEYLKGRGLTDETIARFRLGFAPADGSALMRELTGQEVEQKLLIEAGLFRQGRDGRAPYAFFRDRVLFPIADRRGRIIAFGGRFMGDAKAAGVGKYINSPDTPLFDKGRTLYNLAEARQATHDRQPLIVAEGYMDVIALSQAGLEGGVAPLGTALTEDQITALWQMDQLPYLCFDGDEAGRRAAAKAADRAIPMLGAGRSMKFVFLPEGQDPDSLVQSEGRGAFEAVMDSAKPMDQFLWERESRAKPVTTPEQRADLEVRLNEIADAIPDEVVAKYYRRAFGDRIWQLMREQRNGGAGKAGGYAPQRRFSKPYRRIEGSAPHSQELRGQVLKKNTGGNVFGVMQQKTILACLGFHPNLLDEFEEQVGAIPFAPDLQRVFQTILRAYATLEDPSSEAVMNVLRNGECAEITAKLFATMQLHTYGLGRDRSFGHARDILDDIFNRTHASASLEQEVKSGLSEKNQDREERILRAIDALRRIEDERSFD